LVEGDVAVEIGEQVKKKDPGKKTVKYPQQKKKRAQTRSLNETKVEPRISGPEEVRSHTAREGETKGHPKGAKGE